MRHLFHRESPLNSSIFPLLFTMLLASMLTVGCADNGSGGRATEETVETAAVPETPTRPLVVADAEPVLLSDDFGFTEGPVEDDDGNVYFTNQRNNEVLMWRPDGTIETVLEESGAPSGLALDSEGNLLVCEKSKHRLISLAPDGTVTVLADTYNGEPFNEPNDCWVDPRGGVYFTDPYYGQPDRMPQDGKHVYYITPDGSEVIRVTTDVVHPNGVIGSRDGSILYVADNRGEVKTWAFDINPDGTLANKRLHADEGGDGVTLDSEGNIYLCMDKIYVYSRDGGFVEEIGLPERPHNLCFIGPEKDTLFITAGGSLYTLAMRVKGYSLEY